MYHIVDEPRGEAEDQLCCRPAEFARQMAYLADEGWQVIPLTVLADAARRGQPLVDKAVVVTFDDGTACTLERALPILQRHGFTATVFVVAGLVGGRNDWVRREGHPERALLTAPQLRELIAGGIEVGSHAVSHVRMAGLPAETLAREAGDSRNRLRDVVGRDVLHFAYPYGSHDAAAIAAVRSAGYMSACSTLMGRNRLPSSNLFSLRRTEVKGRDSLWQFKLKLHSGTHDMPPWSIPRAAIRNLLTRSGIIGRPGVPKISSE